MAKRSDTDEPGKQKDWKEESDSKSDRQRQWEKGEDRGKNIKNVSDGRPPPKRPPRGK